MPFINFVARVFKGFSVQQNAPASSGVYGLSNASGWIYIGETENIKARLMEHLQKADPLLRGAIPTGFSFELCHSLNRVARRNQLVLELHPACKP